MRIPSVSALAAVLVFAVGGSFSHAASQDVGLSLRVVDPGPLRAGDRRELVVVLEGASGALGLLVTPSVEGTAVEVVRGRLLRADAESADAPVLQFRLPVVAHEAGTAVLRVHAVAQRCAVRCRSVEARTSAQIIVTAR